MDDPRPSTFPDGWEDLCRDVPALRQQLEDLSQEQHQVARRTAQIDDLQRNMAANVAELSRRQQVLYGAVRKQADQLQQVLEAMKALGGTPSGFVRLAEDFGGSVGMAKRLWKLLAAVAAGVAALYAAFHLGETKGAPAPSEVHEPAPRGDE